LTPPSFINIKMAIEAQISKYAGDEVISLDEARNYLRVDHTDDNTYITELIKIARMQVLKDTNTPVVSTTVNQKLEKFPNDGIIQLRYSGNITNISVIYYNTDDNLTTSVQNTDYRVIVHFGMPQIQMINIPSTKDRKDAILINYTVAPTNSDETLTLKMAMFLLIGHFYDNRSAITFGSPNELPIGYKRIINQYKNYLWE